MKMKKTKGYFLVGFVVVVVLMSLWGCAKNEKNEETTNDSLGNSPSTDSIEMTDLMDIPLEEFEKMYGEYKTCSDEVGGQGLLFSDGLEVRTANFYVSKVIVDVSRISDKSKYTFRGIDGNSTRDDVEKILGEPEDLQFTHHYYKRYMLDDYEFDVVYSEEDEQQIVFYQLIKIL